MNAHQRKHQYKGKSDNVTYGSNNGEVDEYLTTRLLPLPVYRGWLTATHHT